MSNSMFNEVSFGQFVRMHERCVEDDHQRLGQRFINMYIKDGGTGELDTLFYEESYVAASMIIRQWLMDNHHTQELPPVLESWSTARAKERLRAKTT